MDYKKDNKNQEVNVTKDKEPKVEDKEYAEVYNCTHLNLRKTPDAEGDVLLVITKEDKIVIQRVVNDEWTKVTVSGSEGFVMSKYLTEVK